MKPLEQILVWVLTGLITASAVIIWYSVKSWKESMQESIKTVVCKIEDLIKTVNDLAKADVKNSIYIKTLYKQHEIHATRLNDHGDRLKKLELIVAKTKSHEKASQ